jgi:uncharacterized RDD family membrane protein YckC
VTPDDVLGRRVLAALLDLLLLLAVFLLVSNLSGGADVGGGQATARVDGAAALAFGLIVLLYYFAGEAVTGQTPGKRALGLRVVDAEGGGRVPAGRIALRTVLRIVDSLPALYLLGLLCVLLTGERRARLGDLAARTRVAAAR